MRALAGYAIALPLALLPGTMPAQTVAPGAAPATSYEQRYGEVMALEPRGDRAARVQGLVIRRDVAQFTFASGTLYLLSTVGGRTVGAVFEGRGSFSFAPPTRIEQERLEHFEGTRSLVVPFTEVVLLFADATLAELERKVRFGPGNPLGDLRSLVRRSLDYLGHEDSKSLDPDLMAAFLNGESSDLFYAHVNRPRGGPLMFMMNPLEFEGVILASRVPRMGWTHRAEVICRFRRQGAPDGDSLTTERQGTATIRDYRLDVTSAQTGGGGLSFAAAARLDISSGSPVGPWVPFALYSKLRVDSARWEDGTPVTVFRGKEAAQLWVRLDRRLQPGETRPVLVYYHGDLIDRRGDFFFIESSIAWYPRSLEGRSYATFDITYHIPSHYLIASVGDRTESSVADRVLTTRWVSARAIRNASFNLGLFEEHRVQIESVPPVTVLAGRGSRIEKRVGEDMVQSLKFFQRVYGPAPVSQFFAAEIPYLHGEAFPGLVNLSWVTFRDTDTKGDDEVFRAHEVAHQWWGIGVDFGTYHDQWLSEGLANFSGLWYLHAARQDSDKYFGMLRRWRANIFDKRDEPSPIWLGYRASSSKDPLAFQVLIYEKGAWVLHMLRIMMLELRTAKEDRFTAMMRDFYGTFQGGRASTDDFQRVVERHIGMSMDWFFGQWVYGTDIPTYRVAYKVDPVENGQYRVTLRVDQENVAEDFQMYVPVTVDLGQNRQGRFRVNVRGPRSEITLPVLPAKPKGITFNELEGVLCDVKMVGW